MQTLTTKSFDIRKDVVLNFVEMILELSNRLLVHVKPHGCKKYTISALKAL